MLPGAVQIHDDRALCSICISSAIKLETNEITSPDSSLNIPESCADCGTAIEVDDRDFFYWPISEIAAVCFCTACRDMATGQYIRVQEYPVETEIDAIFTETKAEMMARVLEEFKQQIRLEALAERLKPYTPVSLSPLSMRTQCPCVEIDWNKKNEQVKHHCKRKPTKNGFCKDHQLSYKFLSIGARLGYPEVKVPFRWQKQTLHRTIYHGVGLWEDAAINTRRLAEAMDFIEGEYADTLQEVEACK